MGFEEVTGIPGASLKLCYGQGFESDWGNTYSLGNQQADVDDVHFAGFIATLFDNDSTSAVLNYAHAWDITDGFTGLTVMPFIATENPDGTFTFEQNTGGYITRMQPLTNIGDWDALSLLLRTNLIERFDTDIDLFLSGSWSHTSPSQTSENPFFKLMGQGLLNSNGELERPRRLHDLPGRGVSHALGCPFRSGVQLWLPILVQLQRGRRFRGGQQTGRAGQCL